MTKRHLKRWAGVIGLALTMSGCSTIHYVNQDEYDGEMQENWHHIGVLNLVEFSDPVNLKNACSGDDWGMVTTEMSPPNALVCLFVGGLYCPHTIEVGCASKN